MTPVDPSGGSCSPAAAAAAGVELPLAPSTASKGEDEESPWESDWVSDWESDWVSGGEKDPFVKKVEVIPRDDSEPNIKRLKSMKTLTGDDRISPTKTVTRESTPTSDEEDIIEVDDDSTGDSLYSEAASEEDDSFNSEEEAALTPGMACHYCMQRNVKQKVQCSRCPIRFCGLCLLNRNGEKLEVETQEGVKWVCPKCRGGCGQGCNCCCTCAKCKKSRGLRPTGRVLELARATGFDNVHDYLIHRETGESPEKIAKRKDGRCWTNLGGAMSTRSAGKSVGTLKPAQFWADCVPAHQETPKTIAKRKKPGVGRTKAGAAMCSCSRLATVGKSKPPQFWADCPTNRAAVECDNQQTPERFPKKQEGRRGIKAGGGDIGSCSTGVTAGMLKPAQFGADCGHANVATVEFNNEQTRQKNGLESWTVPKAVGDIWQSTDENAKRGDGGRGGAVPPSITIKKVPANVAEVLNNDERERAINERKNVLDLVLGREAQNPLRIKVGLAQILNKLLDLEDQGGRDRSGPLLGGIQQIRRNRKHRKMGRILEPSMFRNRRSEKHNATKINKATPAFPPTVRMGDAHRDLSSRAANNITPEKKPIVQPAGQNAQDARRHQDQLLNTPIQLKRPITSLQALRKMGILPQRKNAEISAAQPSESAQKSKDLPNSPPLADHTLDQSLKKSSHVRCTSCPFSPSRSGSQAIAMRNLERGKKIEFRSCLKPQNKTPTAPSKSDNKLAAEISAWRGELGRPRSELPSSSRHSGVQSRFGSIACSHHLHGSWQLC